MNYYAYIDCNYRIYWKHLDGKFNKNGWQGVLTLNKMCRVWWIDEATPT